MCLVVAGGKKTMVAQLRASLREEQLSWKHGNPSCRRMVSRESSLAEQKKKFGISSKHSEDPWDVEIVTSMPYLRPDVS